MKKLLFLAVLCCITGFANAQKMAQENVPQRRGGWFMLGDTYAIHNADHNAIDVKDAAANFRKIKVTVRDVSLTITKITLVYDAGDNETIDVPIAIAKNGESDTLEINTDGRNIKRIDFWYDSTDFKRGKAEVTVFARR